MSKKKMKFLLKFTVLTLALNSCVDKSSYNLEKLKNINSRKELINIYGLESVKDSTYTDYLEGSTFYMSVLYPNSDNEIGLVFLDSLKRLLYVVQSKPISELENIKVKLGMLISDVEKLNGEPFNFLGFGRISGGLGVFDSGILKNTNISVVFTSSDASSPFIVDDFRLSNHSFFDVEANNLVVSEIRYEM